MPLATGASAAEAAVEAAAGDSSEFVQSLERGLSVIRAFDAEHSRLTLSEVAAATGLSRAAARRFLHTLVHLGYMRTAGGRFELRPKILELGYAYLSSLTLPEVAMPHLEELVEQVHESSSVSELDGGDVVYIARVPTKRIMTVTISVGTRFPAYATSMGRVLLAAQPEPWLDAYLSDRVAAPPHRPHHHHRERAPAGAAQDQGARLGAHRPGTRGGAPLAGGADQGLRRHRGRGGQRRHPRRPPFARLHRRRPALAAAGDGRAHRARPGERPHHRATAPRPIRGAGHLTRGRAT